MDSRSYCLYITLNKTVSPTTGGERDTVADTQSTADNEAADFTTLKETVQAVCYMHECTGIEERETPETVTLNCFFKQNESTLAVQNDLDSYGDRVLVHGPFPVERQDWNAVWRSTLQPVRVTPHIWVSPEWLTPPTAGHERWIKIEPKMAFGTGHHETTRLAAQAIASLPMPRIHIPTLLDIGAGSGILSFVAALNGYAATGIEIDPECAPNMAENARLNRNLGHVQFIIGNTIALCCQSYFDVIVMNMIRTQSEPLLAECRRLLKPGGSLAWSGILVEEKDDVISCAEKKGWQVHAQSMENEWWCGIFYL